MVSSLYPTHYEILGISQQAQLKEVREAYHKLALKCHPDKNPGNPDAVAAFQKLGSAYETLSDENRRIKYDATLSSSQRAKQPPQPANWPPQKPFDPNAPTRTWQEDMRRRAWDSARGAQERADQARREDDEFWSGPTYAHGATDHSGWGKAWDREQKDMYDLFECEQKQRAAREKARKEAEKKKRDINTPPQRDPSDQGAEDRTAPTETRKQKQEAQEKAERERREDDGRWGTPPSPQQPYPDWSDNVEKEYQERLENEKKERADRRKKERKQLEKEWPAELLLLLSKIISIEVEIDNAEAQADKSKKATKDEREDEDHEQIFDLPIKRKSLERRLKECLHGYKQIVKLLRDCGREQEADEAIVKLQEARHGRAGRKESSREEQSKSTTEKKTKAKVEKERGKLSANDEKNYPNQNSGTRQSSKPSKPRSIKHSNAEKPPKTTLPMSDGQDDEDVTRQQQFSREYVADLRVSYDGSDPDRGFTEHTPEPWIAGDDDDYDDEDYDPPFSNDFHDSHMEVHREFWDIIDSWHECNFCRKVPNVFQAEVNMETCQAQACVNVIMESYDLLVINGLVITASDIGHYDIAIKDEKIALLAPNGSLADIATKRVIDAEGGYVMPGGVDAHVHLDEPPLFGKGRSSDNYETGTRSAICGGTTTVITFAPQSRTDPSLLSVLEQTHVKANQNCYTDYSFHLLIANPTTDVLSEFSALREQGISSLKIYMTYEALQLRDNQILDVLLEARRNGITTMIHAENGDILSWMTEQLEIKGLYAPKYHATSRPQIVETEATNRAIALSSIIDTPILIVHVSSPSAAAHIRHAQTKGLPIYAETCPQYLFLTRSDLDRPGFEGAKCVCSPPPREGTEDHEAIWRGLSNGTFTILSSDHCPFVYNDSEVGKKSVLSEGYPEGRFRYIPNGCPGVETRLPLALGEGQKRLGLSKFVEVTSTNAAKLYGLYPRKGTLLPGLSDADLCIWYPEGKVKPFTVDNGQLHHNVDYTPYEGRKVENWVRWTILRGKVMWARDEGGLVGEKGFGEFVKRGVSKMVGSREKGDWKVEGF